MLTQICAEIKNYFSKEEDRYTGSFSIVDGQITPSISILDSQYYRIIGSVFNDGVHQFLEDPPEDFADVLVDEPEFSGEIWLMRVPKDVLDLVNAITEWTDNNLNTLNSPYTSESFGGYSYTKASSSNSDGTVGLDWTTQKQFMSVLNKYRKVCEL